MIMTSAALAMLAAYGPATPVYREVRDWVVVCDNVRACQARSAPEEDGTHDGFLEISRGSGPRGRIKVSLMTPDAERAPRSGSIRLDARPVAVQPAWRLESAEQALVLEGRDALAFMRAIRDGGVLAYSEGETVHTVSLSGLTGALLAIDEAQGRLGTAGAFIRVGGRPDAAVPAGGELPVVMAAPAETGGAAAGFAARVRRAQGAALAAHQCEDDVSDADAAYPLTRSEVLVLLGCLRGAYQSSVLVLRAPRDAPERAKVVVMPPAPGDPPRAAEDLGVYLAEDGWDSKTATLFEHAKGRGLGDCGSSTSWTFDGAQFHLAGATRLDRCAGGPPGDWPVLYRTRTQVR
jgi:hypothetical protein